MLALELEEALLALLVLQLLDTRSDPQLRHGVGEHRPRFIAWRGGAQQAQVEGGNEGCAG